MCSPTPRGSKCSGARHSRAASIARSRVWWPRSRRTRAAMCRTSDRHELALLHVSRLLFLSFLETKGWLNGDRRFLANGFDSLHGARRELSQARASAAVLRHAQHARVGARARRPRVRRRSVSQRRTVRASAARATLAQAAAHRCFARPRIRRAVRALPIHGARGQRRVVRGGDRSRDARQGLRIAHVLAGAPHERGVLHAAVARVRRDAVSARECADARRSLAQCRRARARRGGRFRRRSRRALRERIANMRVLDPACGSGAFLVHALETLAAVQQRSGDTRSLAVLRRELLTRSIFGVDVNPTAVWLCELRLWLSVVIESEETDGMRVPPLPNLDRHIRVGDSLSGDAFEELRGAGGSVIARMRQRYARATGARKRTLERALQRTRAHLRAGARGRADSPLRGAPPRSAGGNARARPLRRADAAHGAARSRGSRASARARASSRPRRRALRSRRCPALRLGDALSRRRAARRLRSRDWQSAVGAPASHPGGRARRTPRALRGVRRRGVGARRAHRERRRGVRGAGRSRRALSRAVARADARRWIARAAAARQDVALARGRRRATTAAHRSASGRARRLVRVARRRSMPRCTRRS